MAGNSLGTAWIQIKPTTTGITSAVKKDLKAVEAQFTGGQFQNIFKGFGSNLHDTFAGAFQKISGTAKTLVAAGIGTATGLIATSVGSAVARIDTLKNAPRVFDAMGYSADSVANSMDRLNDYLDGLPTTLDSAVNNVQLLAASFGGIENGTKYFEALNDAGLAFGVSSEMIENGIRQLSQLSLDGPLDAQTWNSLRNSGFSPVFAAMAKEAGITVGELKEQFSAKGDKTVQDFLDTLVRMDKEGSGSMKSLSEMARLNTDGIATSFTNAKTAITRGIAESIKSIPNLTESVRTAGKSIEGVLKGTMGVDEATQNIRMFFVNMSNGIGEIITKILPLVIKTLPDLVRQITGQIVEFLHNQESMNMLIQGFVELFVEVAKSGVQIAQAIIPLIPQIISTIVSEITKPENIGTLSTGFAMLFGFALAKSIGSNLLNNIKTGVGNLGGKIFGKIIGKDPLKDTGKQLGSSAKSLGTKIAEVIKSIAEPIKQAVTSIGEILNSIVGAVMEPLKTLFKGVGEAIASFFKAFASPEIALGAAMFALAAASIAASIFLIGSAIGAVMPALTELFNNIIMPIAQFIVDTVLVLIDALTNSIIALTNLALIPLGEFLVSSFVVIIQTVSDVISNLTNNALIPLINTLSGAFTNIITAVSNLLTGVLHAALQGIADIIRAVGEGFQAMGNAVKTALEGVQGVLQTFADLIKSIAAAAVAMVAMVTNHSINYGNGYAHLFADGGKVVGPGTDTSDSVPAFLSDGEYVIRTAAAREIGYDNLEELNETGRIRGGQTNYFTINGYNKSPEELANIISRKIAFNQRGVIG